MGIFEIVGMLAFVVLMFSIFNAEEDLFAWISIGSAAVLLICVIGGVVTEPKRPKAIETTHPPHIDTVITIKNNVSDTTYVYTFIEKEVEE